MHQYTLIDSGNEKKLEQFGAYRIIRPCPQAVWTPLFPNQWEDHQGRFTHTPDHRWEKKCLPSSWSIFFNYLQLKLCPTDFGHLGMFPEHVMHWKWIEEKMQNNGKPILNLFAHSGATSLFIAKKGGNVCHLDASKKAIAWARENAELNDVHSVQWIVEDVMKFLKRSVRRKVCYQGVILDPPSFGRGKQGQVFKVERDLVSLLHLCQCVVEYKGFILLTVHTPGLTPLVLKHLLFQTQRQGTVESGEMVIPSKSLPLPSGSYARWYEG